LLASLQRRKERLRGNLEGRDGQRDCQERVDDKEERSGGHVGIEGRIKEVTIYHYTRSCKQIGND
jgi:hypothetical protein